MYTIADYVQMWGNAHSIAFFDPACQFFRLPGIDGIIGYRMTSSHAIVFGDPACPSDYILPLTHAFHEYAAYNGKKVIYLASSSPFTRLMLEHNLCQSAVGVGNEIILDINSDPQLHRGADGSSLRNKWRFSLRRGMRVEEYTGCDPELERRLEQACQAWLAHRKGLQIYLAPVDIFAHRSNKRWFYAHYQDEIVGVAQLNRLDAHNGYVLNLLMLTPQAPTTTSEFLIMSILEHLRAEQVQALSVGMIPMRYLGQIHGWDVLSAWFARHAYALSQKAFKLYRKEQYWKKFAPYKKDLFVMFERTRVGMRDFWSIMQALHVLR
jgi:lysylphosphatidylglycerol synthetase-like protein (DUF2156 family)